MEWYRGESGGYLRKDERSFLDWLMRTAAYWLIALMGFYFLFEKFGGVEGPLGRMLGLPQIIAFGKALLSLGS